MQTFPNVRLYERKTKKDMIMELYRKGWTRKDIANEVGTYYNYVCTVINTNK